MAEGKYQTPAHSVPPKTEGGDEEACVNFTIYRYSLIETLRSKDRAIDVSFTPSTYTHITIGLLSAVSLMQSIMSGCQEKLFGCAKRISHSLKSQSNI